MNKFTEYWVTKNWEHRFVCPNSCLYRFISHIGIDIENKNVLDLGFGEGQELFEMKRRGARIYGIDINKRKFDEVNNLKGDNEFPVVLHGDISTDVNRFQVYFDLIFSQDVLYYLEEENLRLCLKNVKERLRPDGNFIFQVITGDYSIIDNKTIIDNKIEGGNSKTVSKNPIIFRNKEFYISLLKNTGFYIVGEKIVNESFFSNCEVMRHNLYICASIES
ncbi:MAG: class I SAM-dependent methyltransferase [Planctomycetota bacterium]